MRHVLREGDLDRAVVERAPRVVLLLEDDAAVRIDSAEAAERLVRSRRVDAVDVDPRPVVVVRAPDAGHVEAELPAELPPDADDVLVDVGLVEAVGELVVGD